MLWSDRYARYWVFYGALVACGLLELRCLRGCGWGNLVPCCCRRGCLCLAPSDHQSWLDEVGCRRQYDVVVEE